MKKISAILLAILMLSAMGCQPTPEAEIVVSKDGKLERILENAPVVTTRYDFPENAKRLFEATDKLTVDIDAAVEIPEVDSYPAYSVDFAPFSAEQANSLIKTLFGDTPVYIKNGIRTSTEIEAEIINLKWVISEIATGNQGGDVDELAEIIADLEAELASSPDSSSDALYDGTMCTDEEGSYLMVYGNLGKEQDATLTIRNYDTTKSALMLFKNGNEYWADGAMNEQAEGVSLTPDGAIEMVSQWLDSAGMDAVYPIFCRVGSVYQSGDIKGSEGYVVICERKIFEIPFTYNLSTTIGGTINSIPDYTQQFNKEKLTFTVDDTGITTIKWENPFSYTVKNENVPLLSFEEMLTHFTQGIKFKYAWIDDGTNSEGTVDAASINVSNIKLGLTVVPEKDNVGRFMLIPAWDFFGTETTYRDGSAGSSAYFDRSFITINAIDGSIIDRNLDY